MDLIKSLIKNRKESIKKKMLEYRNDPEKKEKRRKASRVYYHKYKEKHREFRAEYIQKNRDKITKYNREYQRKRRARLKLLDPKGQAEF